MGEYSHRSVMLDVVLDGLRPRSGGHFLDATVGGAGHAWSILEASSPDGWLLGIDQDEAAIEAAEARLSPYRGRFELWRGSYGDLADRVPAASMDGVLFDLGLSSPQLDWPERGFSFQHDGPLDMRMDQRTATCAEDLVNTLGVEALSKIFFEFGEEREALKLARAIDRERRHTRFRSTRQLAAFVERIKPRRGKRTHPATKVFQALRIAVNQELDVLPRGLNAALEALKCQGRLVVITFHSAEDRIVKAFGRQWTRAYEVPGGVDVPELRIPVQPRMRWIERKAIKPSSTEVAANPRARSAQLRVLEKL